MKHLYSLLTSFLIILTPLFSQKRVLDSTIFDTWQQIKQFSISDDGRWIFCRYETFDKKGILEITIDGKRIPLIKGGKDGSLFNKGANAIFYIKDTLCFINRNGAISKAGIFDAPIYSPKSGNVAAFKNNTLVIFNSNGTICDSISGAIKGAIFNDKSIFTIAKNNNLFHIINVSTKETLYSSKDEITALACNSSTNTISAYCKENLITINLSDNTLQKFDLKPLIPANLSLNSSKAPQLLTDGSAIIELKLKGAKKEMGKTGKGKKKKENQIEIWRWNDTILPTQSNRSASLFASTFKAVFYPKSGKLVKVSNGYGVTLTSVGDSLLYSAELTDTPYRYSAPWQDPIPKDLYITDPAKGKTQLFIKAFNGTFILDNSAKRIFTFQNSTKEWVEHDISTGESFSVSSKVPEKLYDTLFDEPKEPGSFGQAGVTKDGNHLVLYDRYDIWISGRDNAYCLTKGFGRKNNIKFRVAREDKESIDPSKPILLQSINYNNMHSGFYVVKPGGVPIKLTEGAYKYSYVKEIPGKGYIVKRESFNMPPDYYMFDHKFRKEVRLTNLTDSANMYSFGKSSLFTWKDSLGAEQRGVLYTPEGYDPSKHYPVIVYYYEKMTPETFSFYNPEPTTSTINPAMFVSRGYVVFMPDITFKIGDPGPSSAKIVISGTKELIKRGIADPDRIGVQGHSWGGYQVVFLLTQTNIFRCACSETAVVNMTSAYSGLRQGAGKPRMFMYECAQSRMGTTLWDNPEAYIRNSSLFKFKNITTPLLARHSDGDEAVPFAQGLELFLGLKRLGKEVWLVNYKGDGHNIKKREFAIDWSRRMDEFFDYYLKDGPLFGTAK